MTDEIFQEPTGPYPSKWAYEENDMDTTESLVMDKRCWCPFPGCQKQTSLDKFCCARCWLTLNRYYQRCAFRDWEDFEAGRIDAVQLKRRQWELAREIHARNL